MAPMCCNSVKPAPAAQEAPTQASSAPAGPLDDTPSAQVATTQATTALNVDHSTPNVNSTLDREAGLVQQQPLTSSPTSSEAARRLARYTQEVQIKRPSPLISSPPKPRATAKRPYMPHRSARIAAQTLSHIPTAKRGEVLLMQKMGVQPPRAPVTTASKKAYQAIFTGELSDTQVEAFDEMFPAVKAGRTTRRPSLIAA